MPSGLFNGLPPFAQLMLYGILGLGISGAGVISYVKGLRKERAADGTQPGAEVTARLIKSVDRLDDSINRSTDAVRDSTDSSIRLYRHLAAQTAMPPNEELLVLLRALYERVRPAP